MVHTRICDLLGIEHPILNAPMAGTANAALAAGTDDTVLTRAYDIVTQAAFPPGIGDRVVRNDYTDTWHGRDDELPARRSELHAELVQAAKAGDGRIAPTRAGNAAGLIHAVEPAVDIVRAIIAEAERILRDRPGQLLR